MDAPSRWTARAPAARPAVIRARALLPSLVGLVLAVMAVALLRATGSLRAVEDALVFMGFDPDRSMLITGLIAGAVAAVIVAACAGHPAVAVLASIGVTGAVFGTTFVRETRGALVATGPAGTFDPGGWAVSLLTLVVAAAIVGWAAAMLCAIVRRFVVAAARDLRALTRTHRGATARLARPATVVVAVALLATTLPVFSDMVNFTPDSHMLTGNAPLVGLTGGGPVAGSTSGAGASSSPGATSGSPAPSGSASGATPDPGALPADLVAGPLPASLITPGAVASGRPWASSAPSGSGQMTSIDLPAPWTGGITSYANAEIYLPPGYGTTSTRYPVLYEVPYGLAPWAKGVNIQAMMDNLIGSGAIPPMIIVFASTYGGPYRDVECSDTYDGREHFDRYMATELVPYVDSHFRTIATPAARALLGASQGGYCSAALWSHHPDVFGSAVSFSGYFVSGIVSAETQNAALPFGGSAAYEAAQSPINVVPRLAASLRPNAFVILSADLANAFFGPQLRSFAAALDQARIAVAILPAPLGHSWQTQRDQLPTVLELLAGRMVKLGVFGSG